MKYFNIMISESPGMSVPVSPRITNETQLQIVECTRFFHRSDLLLNLLFFTNGATTVIWEASFGHINIVNKKMIDFRVFESTNGFYRN